MLTLENNMRFKCKDIDNLIKTISTAYALTNISKDKIMFNQIILTDSDFHCSVLKNI